MEEVRDWERLFVGEITAGRDPRIKPARKETSTNLQSVAGFLDAYFERHLRPAGIRSLDTAAGRIKVLTQYFGDLSVKALEEPAIIIQLMLGHSSVQQTQRYLNVTDEELRKGLEVSWKRRTLKAVAGGQNG